LIDRKRRTEGEEVEEVDLLVALLELAGWEVPDKEKEKDLREGLIISFVQPGLRFSVKVVEP